MKVKNIRPQVLVIAVVVVGVVSTFVGYQMGRDEVPQSCGELGATYLEIGKKELGITDFGSEQWSQLIEQETKFVNECTANFSR